MATDSSPSIHLEFAVHHFLEQDNKAADKRYSEGNPHSSIWPGIVDDRLDDYKPSAVLVDSLSPTFTEESVSHEELSKLVWQLMPTGLLKNKASVTVAGGDAVDFWDEAEKNVSVFDKFEAQTISVLAHTALGGSIGAVIGALYRLEEHTRRPVTGSSIDPLISKRPVLERPDSGEPLSRRGFIKRGIEYGILAKLGSEIVGNLPSLMPTHAFDALYHLEDFKGYLIRHGLGTKLDTIADGRTALMIEKSLFLRELLDDKIAVVMGNGHAFNGDFFLHHQEARLQAIKKMIETYAPVLVQPLSFEEGGHQPKPEDKLKLLITEVGMLSIFDVSRPYPSGTPKESWNVSALQAAVKQVDVVPVPGCQKILTDLGII